MSKNKVKIILAIILLIVMCFSALCFADNETSNTVDTPMLISPNPTNTTENSTLISPNVSNSVKTGDQYLVNNSINVDYDVQGNVYILAESATVSSNIVGNVFICAKNVTISDTASISNSLYIAAENANITGSATDLYVAANSLTFAGSTSRDVHLVANNISFSGNVTRDAALAFKDVNFSTSATISGNLDYSSENEASIPIGVVNGSIKFTKSADLNVNLSGLNFVFNPAFRLLCFVVSCFLLGLILKRFAPNFVNNSGTLVSEGPFRTFFGGLLGFIAIPIISILLMISIAASVLGVSILLLYVVFAIVSSFIFVIAINELIAKKLKFDKSYKTILLLIVTSAIAWALTLIPVAGVILSIVYGSCGFGIIVRNILAKKNVTAVKE